MTIGSKRWSVPTQRTLDRIMADDFLFAYPMEGDDKEQFIGDVVSGDVKVEFLSRENVGVRIWGSTAVLTGRGLRKMVLTKDETLVATTRSFTSSRCATTAGNSSLFKPARLT